MSVKKKKKKEPKKKITIGFTLIELLAVIIILGILLLIAIPSVTNYINNSRKESYITTARSLIKGATNLVNSGSIDVYDTDTTYYIPSSCITVETGGVSPYGEFDPAYIVVTYDNNMFYYYWMSRDTTGIGIKNITLGNDLKIDLLESGIKKDDVKPTKAIGTRSKIRILDKDSCSNLQEGVVEDFVDDENRIPPNRECNYEGDLTPGVAFFDGQYRYLYKKEYVWGSYVDMSMDGWSAVLNNPTLTEPVNTELCTSINGKPIVSTSFMFYNSKASSYDLTSFNTSSVVNMTGMFYNAANNIANIQLKGLSFLDTSNVTSMASMFYGFGSGSDVVDLNLTKWNVEKVTTINSIFGNIGKNSQSVKVNASGWNLRNITSFSSTFTGLGENAQRVEVNISKWKLPRINSISYSLGYLGSNAGELIYNLTDFDLSNLTRIGAAFYMTGSGARKVTFVGLETWDVSHITDLSSMFNWAANNAEDFNIDLSNWDVRNVTNFNSMFRIAGSSSKNVNIKLKNWKLNPSATFYDMFAYSFGNSQSLNIDLSGWDLNHMREIKTIFGAINCGNVCNLNLSNWKTSGLTSTNRMFGDLFMQNGKDITINLSNWDASSITNMSYMFYNIGRTGNRVKIIGLDKWNTPSGVDYSYMFDYVYNADIGSFNVKSGNMQGMFYYTSINGDINILENPTNYSGMFSGTNYNSSSTLKVNYKNTVTSIDDMIATAYTNCNVVKGDLIN